VSVFAKTMQIVLTTATEMATGMVTGMATATEMVTGIITITAIAIAIITATVTVTVTAIDLVAVAFATEPETTMAAEVKIADYKYAIFMNN